ncbi:hypothetical protein ONZ45_g8695 [Pleurotus djamor]|nr:hypothetical protein ONZ45_g8695 [Pleurotus djamor]
MTARAADAPPRLAVTATLQGGGPQLVILATSPVAPRIFGRGQAAGPSQLVPYALGAIPTESASATSKAYGTTPTQQLHVEWERTLSCDQEPRYVSTGNEWEVAPRLRIPTNTAARDASPRLTALRRVLEHRKNNALTPYHIGAWSSLLNQSRLITKYPHIPSSLQFGFDLHIPVIHHTQTPPNKSTILEHINHFRGLIRAEVDKARYIGPLTRHELLNLIGPFQTSPFSIMEKPTSPGKYRLLQNFSFPHTPSADFPNQSINSQIGPDDFPATWGTFNTVALIIAYLPPGSQAASRDVAEAYRTIPVHHTQWPGMVARGEDEQFYLDTAVCFGMGPSAGVYCILNDAAKDIFRFKGIGPLSSWVDDHVFFRIPSIHLRQYNNYRSSRRRALADHPPITTGSRRAFLGNTHQDVATEEFDEDFNFPLQDLALESPRADADAVFTYAMDDIDRLSATLGIPWQTSKDQPFGTSIKYLGFIWDLPSRSVTLSPEKASKYIATIQKWLSETQFTYEQAASIHGKLVHASLAIPSGRPYLRELDAMLAICSNRPLVPHHPPRHLRPDLEWWLSALSDPIPPSPILLSTPIIAIDAYSDASSTHGIGIIINGYWRAWKLTPQWETLNGSRDIAWAEAVGFELLIRAILLLCPHYGRVEVFGDNIGVIDAWKGGKSRNRQVNDVFKRISRTITAAPGFLSITASYIPSELNPADPPSRFIFPPASLELPAFPTPDELAPFISSINSTPPPLHIDQYQ